MFHFRAVGYQHVTIKTQKVLFLAALLCIVMVFNDIFCTKSIIKCN